MDRRDRRFRLNGADFTTKSRGGSGAGTQTYKGAKSGIFKHQGANVEVILREESGTLVARSTANGQIVEVPADMLKRWWGEAANCPDAAARLSAAARPARQKRRP